ncbi:MAG: Holliday junction branch migration protein RuvA [Candidatus Limimorpha sp.]|nr:Holliday junction branch migration protein RuvA [Bacteroidales bacterium]MCI7378154.1 Holliday junction branch migration protein RuvA [Bacteroidales bacterium]MDD5979351.1 Holliday junction branch migration protein RuvA [Bacteroidales bacterium]MDD7276353.1 Holliday junction branch migration protein RuvA [Bacteroidales bacterium]MDY6074097.1 Holliday junction branch migration protein RuvA [Bacteroidales bacterium]
MYSFISGTVVEKNPAYVIIDNQGIGYLINITLNTFTAIGEQEKVRLYVHLAIREDAHTLYGFYTEQERSLFLQLITVSGVGCNTARLILSSMTVKEAAEAIATSNTRLIQGVKGIGAKTAQRIVVDLHDKIGKLEIEEGEKTSPAYNTTRDEALSALMVLGFSKANIEKILDKLMKQMDNPAVEDLIKESLRLL